MGAHAQRLRYVAGALMAAAALAIAFGLDTRLTTAIPDYTSALQEKVETPALAAPVLQDFGRAPDFAGISGWINSQPLSLHTLRGKVVLVDFWTYSCINCLRTLPHLQAWYAAYHRRGLEIVGVHTPEFAFEHVPANVRAATRRLHVTWPVAIDDDYATWKAYGNQYWPAEYLVDRQGRLRHVHFGEGEYGDTEGVIRQLLGEPGQRARPVADNVPHDLTTPESYLGYRRLDRYAGSAIRKDRATTYRAPAVLPQNELAYAGAWTVGAERIVAGRDARLALHFVANKVFLVLGGHGRVEVRVEGERPRTVRVDGDRLYTLRDGRYADATMRLRFTRGVAAYAFTFG